MAPWLLPLVARPVRGMAAFRNQRASSRLDNYPCRRRYRASGAKLAVRCGLDSTRVQSAKVKRLTVATSAHAQLFSLTRVVGSCRQREPVRGITSGTIDVAMRAPA